MTRAALLPLLLLAGCDTLDRVNRPLPEHFSVQSADRGRLQKASMAGRAWVVELWVPG